MSVINKLLNSTFTDDTPTARAFYLNHQIWIISLKFTEILISKLCTFDKFHVCQTSFNLSILNYSFCWIIYCFPWILFGRYFLYHIKTKKLSMQSFICATAWSKHPRPHMTLWGRWVLKGAIYIEYHYDRSDICLNLIQS